MNRKDKRYQYIVNQLITYGCDYEDAIIAAKAIRSPIPACFWSDREMQAIDNCTAKVAELKEYCQLPGEK